MHEAPAISDDSLLAALGELYGIEPSSLEFLPVGDTHTASYRGRLGGGERLFLKLRPAPVSQPSLRAPRFLSDRGIGAVVAPLATAEGALSFPFSRYDGVVFPYVEGEKGWQTITDEHWREAGRIFQRIHSIETPGTLGGSRREDFEPSVYAEAVRGLEKRIVDGAPAGAPLATLRAAWTKHQETIQTLLESMLNLAEGLKSQAGPLLICHADLHASNLLRDTSGRVFVIDWDDVMRAPKERDFIFGGEPGSSPFFEGYGPTDIDWAAVTYYRYERVITDLIAYGGDVFNDTLSDATKTNSVERFVMNLEGQVIAAARRAAERLPR